MRYSLVLATLAASAIATPYINVEVSEPGDVVVTNNNKHHHNDNNKKKHHDQHDGLRRPHRGGRNDRDDRDDGDDRDDNTSWFSSLWRKNRNDEDRRGHHGGRGDRDDNDRDYDDGDDDDFHTNNFMDDLFGSDYECVLEAVSQQKERRDARECCREVGGELYDIPGRCVFRDVYENPREEWRSCAMGQSGAVFADCYYREQREVDDELSSRRRNSQSRSRSRDDEDRERRNRNRNHRNRNDRDRKDHDRNDRDNDRNDRDNDRNGHDRDDSDHQIVLNHREIECRLALADEHLVQALTEMCCRSTKGRLTQNGERCEIRHEFLAHEFQRCVEAHGVRNDKVRCRDINSPDEF